MPNRIAPPEVIFRCPTVTRFAAVGFYFFVARRDLHQCGVVGLQTDALLRNARRGGRSLTLPLAAIIFPWNTIGQSFGTDIGGRFMAETVGRSH
jgi:hypothetical protein